MGWGFKKKKTERKERIGVEKCFRKWDITRDQVAGKRAVKRERGISCANDENPM